MRLFVATALLLLGLAAVPNAQAAEPALGLLECRTQSYDAQHDGSAESWKSCSTPTCGCYCPVVGAGVVVETSDQQVSIVSVEGQQTGAVAATSGCQTAYATTSGEDDGGEPVTVLPRLDLAGLGGVTLA